MTITPPPIDDRLHEAARSILDNPAWDAFREHFLADVAARFTQAAQIEDAIGVAKAAEHLRALGTVHDTLQAIAADARVKASVADRRRRRVDA